MRVGYACIPLGEKGLRGPRTTVLRLATPEKLRGLIHENIEGLLQTLAYNEQHGIRRFRISSEFIPFGSHAVNVVPWWEEFAWLLEEVGRVTRGSDHRLSFHVSPYTVLNSEREEVVLNSLSDVEYQARVLDSFGLDREHRVVVHLGVTSPGRAVAADRFLFALDRLTPNARGRLVVENDDRSWPVDEVVAVARRGGVPVVYDTLHHQVLGGAWSGRPTAEVLADVFATWKPADGAPKIHFSSQDPEKRPGAHAWGIDPTELTGFLHDTAAVDRDFDIMFEAKGKDLAVREILPLVATANR